MSAGTTPAVERAAEALKAATGVTYPWALDVAPSMLGAALDVEELARELFVADSWQDRDFMLQIWRTAPDDQVVKEHWRRIARGLRVALLGGAS